MMPRIRVRAFWSWVLVGIATQCGVCHAATPLCDLLPASTAGYVAVSDWPELASRWKQSELAQLISGPLNPWLDDLVRQIRDRRSGGTGRLGLTLEDIRQVASGEVAAAVVEVEPSGWGFVLLIDVTGRVDQARKLVETASERLVRDGALRKSASAGGTPLVVLHLAAVEGFPRDRRTVYFLHGNLLGVASHAGIVRDTLGRAAGTSVDTLAKKAAFEAVMNRCRKDAAGDGPQIAWFVEPVGFVRALESCAAGREGPDPRRRGKPLADLLETIGFSAVQGIGGLVEVGWGDYELLHRTFVLVRPPFDDDGRDFTPQGWVPSEVATYSTGYVDVRYIFDAFGPMFDELVGGGDRGSWEDVLAGLRDDPSGPKVDLREDLVGNLTGRVTVVSGDRAPTDSDGERLLVALETTDEAAIAECIARLFRYDNRMRRRELGKFVVWEAAPPEAPAVPVVTLEMPELTPAYEAPPEPVVGHSEQLAPHMALTVAHGQLIVASHGDFLDHMLAGTHGSGPLAGTADYALVDATLGELAVTGQCARIFSRPARELRSACDLDGKGKTSRDRLVRQVLGGRSSPMPRTDVARLPEYDHVASALGPAGHFIACEPDGWFWKGFLLKRRSLEKGGDGVRTARRP